MCSENGNGRLPWAEVFVKGEIILLLSRSRSTARGRSFSCTLIFGLVV